MTYRLDLTQSDIDTASFVGNRYDWSLALLRLCSEGENELAEHEAWELFEAFQKDTDGGHNFFPMLDPRSDLSGKLYRLMDKIV